MKLETIEKWPFCDFGTIKCDEAKYKIVAKNGKYLWICEECLCELRTLLEVKK